jgi:dephospho-CoA kinase
MLSFSQYNNLEFLEEKLILFNNGANYGQIVLIAGGAGSGKGFAIQKFMRSEVFKIRDVDEYKKAFLKLNAMTDKYPELSKLNLKIPADVSTLHAFVAEKGIKDKTLDLILRDLKPDRLPNIMFDTTFDDIKKVQPILTRLVDVGYLKQNIHLVWVLTEYDLAAENNENRDRVVSRDILLKTHVGASRTVFTLIRDKTLPEIDGSIHVILNNKEETVRYNNPNAAAKNKEDYFVVKSFNSMQLKSPGKPMNTDKELTEKLTRWVRLNAPKQAIIDLGL